MAHPLPPAPGTDAFDLLARGWTAEPALLLGLAAAAVLYAAGWVRLGRRARGRAGLPAWRARCFAGGLGVVALATMSPLHAWGEHLLAAHMVQHLALVMGAPPLLWLGAPLLPLLWGLPRPARRAVGALVARGRPVGRLVRRLTRPAVAATLATATVALWHWPPLYDAAQGRKVAHDLEHALFLATALLYWWPLVYPAPGRRPLAGGPALLHLLPPMVTGDVIGAVLSMAQTPVYATYAAAPRPFGLSPLADQQIGGLAMWVGGGLLWLAAMALVLFLLPQGTEDRPAEGPLARPGPAPRRSAPAGA